MTEQLEKPEFRVETAYLGTRLRRHNRTVPKGAGGQND